VLDPKEGNFGVQIPANTWHSLEVQVSGSVIFEVKEGPYIPHEVGGMLENNQK
jgi:cupin fold WbuC family metalloprotein